MALRTHLPGNEITAPQSLHETTTLRLDHLPRLTGGQSLNRSRQLEILSQASAELLKSADPQQLVNSLCRRVMQQLDCHAFFNYLVDREKDCLHLNACAGIPDDVARSIEWLEYGAAVCGCAARDGCRIVAENIPATPDLRTELVKSFGIKAYACHPLITQQGVIGTLSFGTCSRTHFSEDELDVMKTLADQVAVAMQRKHAEQRLKELNETLERRVAERTAVAEERASQLQKLASQLTQAEERERQRVAHILHEHFQQLLVGAKFDVSVLESQLRSGNTSPTPIFERLNQVLDEAISESRSLSVELSPPILYAAGLTEALHWLGSWMRDKHGLQVDVQADKAAEPHVDNFRILLFHAVRELLFNVVKHARVERARVAMRRCEGNQVEVVVSDEGIGFRADDLRRHPGLAGGFGLFGLSERLQLLGGQLQIDSRPGYGTQITLQLPRSLPQMLQEPPASGNLASVVRQPVAASMPVSAVRAERIRILLADDHTVVRDGLARLLQLQPDLEVVGQAADGQQAVDQAMQLQPDVILMDVSMPRLSGIEATRRIKSQLPRVRVVGLSMHNEPDVAAAMTEAGAVNYLTKTAPPESLVAAIRAAQTACE